MALIKRLFNMEGALMAQPPLLKSHPWLLSSLVISVCWRKHIQMLATSEVTPFPFSSQLGSNTSCFFYPQSISACLLREARFLDHKPFPLSISSGQKLPTNALTLVETDTSFIHLHLIGSDSVWACLRMPIPWGPACSLLSFTVMTTGFRV